jgi:hypothetical protein
LQAALNRRDASATQAIQFRVDARQTRNKSGVLMRVHDLRLLK